VLPTLAGPEIGVASTKAFTTQLAVLRVYLAWRRARGASMPKRGGARRSARRDPSRASEVLNHDERIQEIAAEIALARDVSTPARHGLSVASKRAELKEISYIMPRLCRRRDEAWPVALIDDNVRSSSWRRRTSCSRRPVECRGGDAPAAGS